MKLIRGIHNLSQAPQEGCVLTIGNFDGVHRGHRALLQGLQEEGRKRNLPVMVMLFEPQPLELFATDKAPARLTRLREKLREFLLRYAAYLAVLVEQYAAVRGRARVQRHYVFRHTVLSCLFLFIPFPLLRELFNIIS